jgi:hypothetical protein
LGVFAVCNPLKVCPKSLDDGVNVPNLTPKKLIAYKRGIVLKKAAALAAFQQVATDEDDELIVQSRLPATIEQDEQDGDAEGEEVAAEGASSGDGHLLQTLAEVLPVREPVESSGQARTRDDTVSLSESTSSAVDRFQRKRRKPFVAFGDGDDAFDDGFETNTVINDLFGEELEMMDQERLKVRYDVLNLEDIGIEYDEDKLLGIAAGDSATSETRLTSPPRTKTTSFNVASLRKSSQASNFSTWDDFDAASLFDGSERGKRPSSSSVRRKAVKQDEDEF